MRRGFALALRLLRQFRHDPRTLFMMIVAPIVGLAILNVIFGSPDYEPLILTVDTDGALSTALVDADARVRGVGSVREGLSILEDVEADAILVGSGDNFTVYLEGSDPSKSGAVLRAIAQSRAELAADVEIELEPITLPNGAVIDPGNLVTLPDIGPPEPPEIVYVHGLEDMDVSDFFGPVFIGILVFFFVFITSGISFVRERTGGTLERMMATPVRRWQIVMGYALGFGLFALVQSLIVAWASIYWVGFPNLGSFWLVLLVAVSMALVSMTLGILVSEFANTELQVIQLLQIVVIPQILLSGIFDLSQTPGWMQTLSRMFPITYGAEAMRDVMLRGAPLGDIAMELGVLWGFVAVFFTANILALRKYRRV